MNIALDVTAWFEAQVGQSRIEVLADAKAKIAETRSALIQAQRGAVSLQKRAGISTLSKADRSLRNFLAFAQKMDKKPAGILPADWMLYQPIVQAWVDQAEVKPEVAALFHG